jgi:uncharacterized membrane protein
MRDAEAWLTRWQNAGLLSDAAVAAIRQYEAQHAQPTARRWQVSIALIFGAMLLGAGIFLFVAAHWDALSPFARLSLVLFMLCFFHGLGWLTHNRFAGFAAAMHAVGTISAGAAIALVGQIFNMQEHWPAAVMLWALCAAAGWALLRDQSQQCLALLIVPAWILSEFSDWSSPYGGADTWLARILALIGAVYITAFLHSKRRIVFSVLFTAGALILPCAVFMLTNGWSDAGRPPLPLLYQAGAVALAVLVIGAGWLFNRGTLPVVLVVGAIAWALPWAQTSISESFRGSTWRHSETNLVAYLLVAGACVFLVWWGIRLAAKPLVNYGVAAFALTVLWFFFSNLMNKLDRSFGLILLGVLFLAGGWALERMRRRIVAGIESGGNA